MLPGLSTRCTFCPIVMDRLSPRGREEHYSGHYNEAKLGESSTNRVPEEFIDVDNDLVCQICKQDYFQTSEQLEAHYNNDHFGGEGSGSAVPLESQEDDIGITNVHRPWLEIRAFNQPGKGEDAFWIPEDKTTWSHPWNFTPGLMPVIKKALIKSHAKGNTSRAVLCSDSTTHIYRESWDSGWGCGYRNFEMVCTALLSQKQQPEYHTLLKHPIPPSVRNLQQMIETAWKDGADAVGRRDFPKGLAGYAKWVGTTDLFVAFIHRGIPGVVVDFDSKGADCDSNGMRMKRWVVKYFSSNLPANTPGHQSIISTNKMPLILQHSGHSRTVVGFEEKKDGEINLLMFDPSRRPNENLRRATQGKPPTNVVKKVFSSSNDKKTGKGASNPPAQQNKINHFFTPKSLQSSSSSPIVIDDGDENEDGIEYVGQQTKKKEMAPAEVLNQFRRTSFAHKMYQILYFPYPLEPPLDKATRRDLLKVIQAENGMDD